MSSASPENVILAAKRFVESDKRSEIRLNANGGNSILIVCPPEMELEYIQAIEQQMNQDAYSMINLNQILNDYVELNKEELEARFDLLRGSVHQVFKTPAGEEGPDLFNMIIQAISVSLSENKIPVLINTGSLYGSGIDNIHIMENEVIMKASLPLLILYPATKDGDNLMFLGKRPASKYRCVIID